MITVPIYKGKKINKMLCIIFLVLFVPSLAAAIVLPAPFIVLAQIFGAFALLYGILWSVWAGREKKAEKALQAAEAARVGQHESDGFFSREYVIPKEDLTEAAFRRLISIVKGCVYVSLAIFALITLAMIFSGSFGGPAHAAAIMLFSFAISVPGIIIQIGIYRKYEKTVPRKIGMYPGKLIIDDTLTASRDIREVRISPERLFNANSPSIFRKLTVSTTGGEKYWCIDYRSYAASGKGICWNEYTEFAQDLKEWGKTNEVPVTTEYMD